MSRRGTSLIEVMVAGFLMLGLASTLVSLLVAGKSTYLSGVARQSNFEAMSRIAMRIAREIRECPEEFFLEDDNNPGWAFASPRDEAGRVVTGADGKLVLQRWLVYWTDRNGLHRAVMTGVPFDFSTEAQRYSKLFRPCRLGEVPGP